MGKKKKKGSKKLTSQILLATAILDLLVHLIELIDKIMN